MTTTNTYLPCRVLRDAMQVAAMFAADDNERSRMTFDRDGMHIRSRNYANSMMAWVDVPLKSPAGSYFEHEDIGIDSDKLYRMLSAYEPDDMLDVFTYPHHDLAALSVITVQGALGMLSCSQPPLSDIPSIPIFDYVQRCHPPVVRGDVGADHCRGWLKQIEAAGEDVVSFQYQQPPHGMFPIMMVSEHTSLQPQMFVLSHPSFPEGIGGLSSNISLELLHTALAPSCVTGDVMFAFGDDTPLYIETQVNDCTVRVAIAPRIEV